MGSIEHESDTHPATAFFADGDAGVRPAPSAGIRGSLVVLGSGLGIGLLLSGTSYGFLGSVPAALYWLFATMIYSCCTLVLWRYVLPRFAEYSPLARALAQWGTALASFAVLSLVTVEMGYSVFGIGHGSILTPYAGGDIDMTIAAEALRRGPWLFALMPILPTAILCIVGFNQSWWRIFELEGRQEELRELAISAQLAALRAQLNPHFLFNSLNSIAELVRTDPDRAEECIERLAEILRYVLQRTQIDMVPLSDEVRVVQAYLEIEQARFGDSLVVETKVDEGVRSVMLPGLILQPLVENAVKHGVSGKVEGGRITIEAVMEGADLRIAVRDTGVGMDLSDSVFDRGVGLRNLRERLIRRYGPGYEPVIESDGATGTSITVRVPMVAAA